VCLGKATKVCELLTDKDKEYEAVMLLGTMTDTQDITGTVLSSREVKVSEEEVCDCVQSFVGDYMQVPPMYSALKVDGRKLCDLARAGVTVERAARPVTIHSITILSVELPRVRMRVNCSKGTYIRTLCQDIGDKLGCGACMESLLRTKVSSFAVDKALRLSEIEELVAKESSGVLPQDWTAEQFSFVDSIDSVFGQYERAVVKSEFSKLLYNGNRIRREMFCAKPLLQEKDKIRIYDEKGQFIGIYECCNEDYKPVKLFIG
jgi:tRNA pseudouridine55 synthase